MAATGSLVFELAEATRPAPNLLRGSLTDCQYQKATSSHSLQLVGTSDLGPDRGRQLDKSTGSQPSRLPRVRQCHGVTFVTRPAQSLPGSFWQAHEGSPGQSDSTQSSGEPSNGGAGDLVKAQHKISVHVNYMLDVDFQSKSADDMVPTFTLGSTYVLTKADARMPMLASCLSPLRGLWNSVWGQQSILGDKVAFWVSRQAACDECQGKGFDRWERSKLLQEAQRRNTLEDSTKAEQSGEDSNLVSSAAEALSRSMMVDRSNWRLWRTEKEKMPWWMPHPPDLPRVSAKLEEPLSAPGQAELANAQKTPKIVEIPLVQALAFMRQKPQWCALGPCAAEFHVFQIGARLRDIFKHRRKPNFQNEVPAFTIPGVTLELPSTKGPVQFTPYFLSREELLKVWATARQLKLAAARNARARLRKRALLAAKQRVAYYAAKWTGLEGGAPSDIAMPPESEDEPSEMHDFLQELGIRPGPSGIGGGPPRPFALSMLGLAGCGAASLAASTAAMTLNVLDRITIENPIGKRLMINLPKRPIIHAQPLRQTVAAAREHNASLLGGTAPPGTACHSLKSSQTSLAAAPVDNPDSITSIQSSFSDASLHFEVPAQDFGLSSGASKLLQTTATTRSDFAFGTPSHSDVRFVSGGSMRDAANHISDTDGCDYIGRRPIQSGLAHEDAGLGPAAADCDGQGHDADSGPSSSRPREIGDESMHMVEECATSDPSAWESDDESRAHHKEAFYTSLLGGMHASVELAIVTAIAESLGWFHEGGPTPTTMGYSGWASLYDMKTCILAPSMRGARQYQWRIPINWDLIGQQGWGVAAGDAAMATVDIDLNQVRGSANTAAERMPGTALQGLILLGEQGQCSALPFPEPAVIGLSNGAHLEENLKAWP